MFLLCEQPIHSPSGGAVTSLESRGTPQQLRACPCAMCGVARRAAGSLMGSLASCRLIESVRTSRHSCLCLLSRHTSVVEPRASQSAQCGCARARIGSPHVLYCANMSVRVFLTRPHSIFTRDSWKNRGNSASVKSIDNNRFGRVARWRGARGPRARARVASRRLQVQPVALYTRAGVGCTALTGLRAVASPVRNIIASNVQYQVEQCTLAVL